MHITDGGVALGGDTPFGLIHISEGEVAFGGETPSVGELHTVVAVESVAVAVTMLKTEPTTNSLLKIQSIILCGGV